MTKFNITDDASAYPLAYLVKKDNGCFPIFGSCGDLDDNVLFNDVTDCVIVAPGCKVILYEHSFTDTEQHDFTIDNTAGVKWYQAKLAQYDITAVKVFFGSTEVVGAIYSDSTLAADGTVTINASGAES